MDKTKNKQGINIWSSFWSSIKFCDLSMPTENSTHNLSNSTWYMILPGFATPSLDFWKLEILPHFLQNYLDGCIHTYTKLFPFDFLHNFASFFFVCVCFSSVNHHEEKLYRQKCVQCADIQINYNWLIGQM